MWAPGALGHHRELPVDVPDTLLQKAYPNKVKNCSPDCRNGLQHRPRSASDLDLSLNLKNETLKTRTIADGRARLVSNDCTDVTDHARTISICNGLQPPMKIELKIEDEEEKVRAAKRDPSLDKYHGSPTVTGSPGSKRTFEDFEEEENIAEDAGGQKESSVDVEDDYPFAKEDYPTMLKTCSDDSASPRSSSGRSDSTAPLDTSLMLKSAKSRKDSPTYDVRRIDLGSPCRSVVPDIKVAPLFGRARDATSFDNPAYGLTDLQDLQGLLMRSDEVSDLTRLIDEQCSIPRIPKDQDKASPGRGKDQQTEPAQTEMAGKSGKSSKRRQNEERVKLKAKTRSLDIEELIRAGSTDDLIGIELSNLSSSSRQRPKKKRHQQISSGYSTLRSEASGDLELSADRSFLVVGGKAYREVAVDCPPDFVPVTKCHPVYPPPNKTPGNSKHNTLEPRRDRENAKEGNLVAGVAVAGLEACAATTTTTATATATATTTTPSTTTLVASPCLPPNDYSLATLSSADGSARENVVALTVDRKNDVKKVRFRVKSLMLDGLHSAVYHEARYWHRHSLRASNTHLSNTLEPAPNEPVLHPFNMQLRNFDPEPTSSELSPGEQDGSSHTYENPAFVASLEDVRVLSPGQRFRKSSGITSRVRSILRARFRYRRDPSVIFHKDGEKIVFDYPMGFEDLVSRDDVSSCASEGRIFGSFESLLGSRKVSEEATSSDSPTEIAHDVWDVSSCGDDVPPQEVATGVPSLIVPRASRDRTDSSNSGARQFRGDDLQCRGDSPDAQLSTSSNSSDECRRLEASGTFPGGRSREGLTAGVTLRRAFSCSNLSNLMADHSSPPTIRSSLPDFELHSLKISHSWHVAKWNKRVHSVASFSSNECTTKQDRSGPPTHAVGNDTGELHEDTPEEQVNCNGL